MRTQIGCSIGCYWLLQQHNEPCPTGLDTKKPDSSTTAAIRVVMGRLYEIGSTESYYKSPYRDIPYRAVWQGFKENTTAHGIPHVSKARGVLKTSVWLVLSLASLGGFCYNLYLLGDKYFLYPSKVLVRVEHKTNMTFPAVTICNNNPVLKSVIECGSNLSNSLFESLGGYQTCPNNTKQDPPLITPGPAVRGGSDGTSGHLTPGPIPAPPPTRAPLGEGRTPDPEATSVKGPPVPGHTPNTGLTSVTGPMAAPVPTPATEPTLGPEPTTVPIPSTGLTPATGSPGPTLIPGPTSNPEPTISTVSTPFPGPPPNPGTAGHPSPPGPPPDPPTTALGRKRRAAVPPTGGGPETGGGHLGGTPPSEKEGPATSGGKTLRENGEPSREDGGGDPLSGDGGPLGDGGEPLVKKPTGQFDGSSYNKNGRARRANFESWLQVQRILAEMPLDEKVPLGQTIESLVLDCEFEGATCNTSTDFTSFYNNMYGNCYTFNSGWDRDMKIQYSSRPGPIYGLSLVFNVNQSEYVADLAESAGVVVAIHPQERMPFPEDEGLHLAPGRRSYIATKLVSIMRASTPWGTCVTVTEKNFTRNVYEEKYGTNYSSNACYKTCFQRNVIQKCECGDARFPMYGAAFDYVNVSACDSTSVINARCMALLERGYAQGALGCSDQCPEACSESVYVATVSSNLWPSTAYANTLFDGLAEIHDVLKNVTRVTYKENVGKVTVFLQEFNYESIVESEAYSPFMFISDIGGILGLYIGFSLLSIMEFVELGVDLAILSCLKGCKSHRNRPTSTKVMPSGDNMPNDTPPLNTPPPYKTAWWVILCV